jgi:hypothetical protein
MQQQEEIWKDIPGYEGLYQASSLGKIKSLNYNHTKEERVLKIGFNKNRYCSIVLCKNNKKETRTIHQLVAITFLNHIPCGAKLVVNHKNFNKLDNRVDNLEIVTTRENSNKKHLKSSSKYIGSSWDKQSCKWKSYICIESELFNLGFFEQEIEAHNTYKKALKNWEENGIKPIKKVYSSIYKGVSWNKKMNKWRSGIKINKKSIHLGYFENEIDASNAYQNKLKELK